MISNEVIQADLLDALQGDASILAQIGSAIKVKESQYAGRDIDYPALRLKIARQVPIITRGHCDHARLSFWVRIMTEGNSSRQAMVIAGLVNSLFHGPDGKYFSGTGWYTYFRSAGMPSPSRTGEILWFVDPSFEGVVYPTS